MLRTLPWQRIRKGQGSHHPRCSAQGTPLPMAWELRKRWVSWELQSALGAPKMGHRNTCRVPRTALATLSTWSLMIFLLCLQMRKLEWTENDVVSPTRVKLTEGKLVIGKWRGTRPRKQDEAIRKWKKGGKEEKWLQLPLSQNFGASACVFWELETILWPSAQVILKHPMFLLLTQAEMRHQAATLQPPVIWLAYMCAVVLPLRTKNVSILWPEVHGVSALFFVLLREAIKLGGHWLLAWRLYPKWICIWLATQDRQMISIHPDHLLTLQ